uniref:non-specific serine/threonine protein kinase n=1 Tax=Kalanchoe fedtschenkoi TaxID=63787 RepID=A0A7N0UPJ8_KALFE
MMEGFVVDSSPSPTLNDSCEVAKQKLKRDFVLVRSHNILVRSNNLRVPEPVVHRDLDAIDEDNEEEDDVVLGEDGALKLKAEVAEDGDEEDSAAVLSKGGKCGDESMSKGSDEENRQSYESEPDTPKSNNSSDSDQSAKHSKSPPRHSFFKSLKMKSSKTGLHFHFQPLPSLGVSKRVKKVKEARDDAVQLPQSDGGLCHFRYAWKNFTLSDLQNATDNFSQENLIGEGGYSRVYKGKLENGTLVAVKRLTGGTSQEDEMTADFLSELGIMVHLHHPNIAQLIGYGVEGGMYLVLHLSPHGSLAALLRGSKEKLNWDVRFKIAVGTAEGLLYLHEGCQRRIIHKDIKAANILLTEDFEPKISDYGLAKWLPEQWTHHVVSNIEGTFGYLPPEFFMNGIVDEKTDVYAYGVVLLELLTGRLAMDDPQKSLVMWAKPLIEKNSIDELVDPSISGPFNPEQLNRVILTAALCTHHCPDERPQMNQVVEMLSGNASSLDLAKQILSRSAPRTVSEQLFIEDDCISMDCHEDDVLKATISL